MVVRRQVAIHIDNLARCAGYSERYFSVLFKAATGMTPADYIFVRRMQRAQELLRTREHTISEVGRMVVVVNRSISFSSSDGLLSALDSSADGN